MIPPSTSAALAQSLLPLPGHPAAFLGPKSAHRTQEVLEGLNASRVLVVHGRTSFSLCGADRIAAEWEGPYTVRHFDGFHANPQIRDVREGVRLAREFRPDAVVGIGGGSALDVAKAIAVLASQDADPAENLTTPGLLRARRQCALILLPTTSGSGSEMTTFATIYDGSGKHSLDHPQVRSDLVLIDPDLTASMPLRTAVAAGLDALCQAVESYWAVSATEESRSFAHSAMAQLFVVLESAASRGFAPAVLQRPEERGRLALAAATAGTAINITRTTAAHALSYLLTARQGLSHGAAVAVHLRWLISHHAQVTAEDCRHPGGPEKVLRLIDDIQKLSHEVASLPLEDLIARLLRSGGYPADLAELALSPQEWTAPLTSALTSGRAANSPRAVTEADVWRLLS